VIVVWWARDRRRGLEILADDMRPGAWAFEPYQTSMGVFVRLTRYGVERGAYELVLPECGIDETRVNICRKEPGVHFATMARGAWILQAIVDTLSSIGR
jgi:hypothetical protein